MESFTKLVLTGFLMIMLGFMMLLLASLPLVEAKGGGALVIFIGPFPLAVGFGEYSPILILVSVIIAAAMIFIMLLYFKYLRVKPENS